MTTFPAPDCDWLEPSHAPRLQEDAVDVWRIDLDTPRIDPQQLRAALAEHELRRANTMRDPVGQRRYLMAHWAVRHILAGYVQRSAESLVFDAGKYGKPFLSQPGSIRPLHFNLAHSANLALCAIAHVEVGIDVEQSRPLPQISEAAQQVLSAQEMSLANHLGDDDRQAALHILWTCKEAYLKATGTGLRRDVTQVTVLVGVPAEPSSWFPLNAPRNRALARLLSPREGFFAALVVMGSLQDPRCRRFSAGAFGPLSTAG